MRRIQQAATARVVVAALFITGMAAVGARGADPAADRGPDAAANASPDSLADLYELPEVTVEASRWKADTALPLATTVIDRAAIESSGAMNLGEILRPVVGVRVATTGGLGAFTPISIRGSSNDQVLVLMDGRRLNVTQGGGVDLSDVPLDNIERIEVVRGGASAIYGADAIGGTINLISRGVPAGPEAGARLEYGSFDTRLLSAHLAGGLGRGNGPGDNGPVGAGWRLDGRLCQSDGPERKGAEPLPGGEADIRGDLDSDWLSGRVTWKPAWVSSLDLSANHESSDKGVPGSLEFASGTARQSDEFSAAALELTGLNAGGPLFSGPSATSGARLFAQRRRRGYADPNFPLGAVDDRHRNDSWGFLVDQHRDVGRAGQVEVGLEGRRDELDSSTDGHHLRNSAAAWARQTVTFGESATTLEGAPTELTPALRYDTVEGFAGHLSPLLMGRHRISRAVQLRGSVGSAFRPPSFDDLFLPPRASAAGNPDLKPEQSWNADLGLGWTLGGWTLGMTGFVKRVRDLIQWQPGAAGVWRPHNVDGAWIAGAEFDVAGRLPISGTSRVADISANYTWLDPRETGTASNTAGKVLIYRPRHKVNAQLRLPLGAISLETQWGYTGPVFTTRANTRSLPGYLVGDAGLAWSFRPAMTLEARCLNLTDVAYQDFRDYPAPGREWRLAMTWRSGR